MVLSRKARHALPFQVAAVCYRMNGRGIEFLLVNTNGGNKWTFPKGSPSSLFSHSEAAAREAMEEAGVHGQIEPRHFSLYLHSKGVFWKPPGVTEYVVAAFLMEVERSGNSCEPQRNPTWFNPIERQGHPGQRPRGEIRPRIARGDRQGRRAHSAVIVKLKNPIGRPHPSASAGA